MIEIEYIDSKPQVIINKKKIKTWDTLEEGCVYAEVGNQKITVLDFEHIRLNAIPNKLIALIFFTEKRNQNYHFNSLIIKKRNDNDFSLTFSGDIKSRQWNIKYFYSIFKQQFEKLSDRRTKAYCTYDDDDNVYLHFLLSIDQYWKSKTIKEVLEHYNKKTDLVYQQTFEELNSQIIDKILLSETVSLKFNFPKHLRDICKQYLSYFGKFLFDQNIECNLNLIDRDDITYMTIDVDESQIDIEELKQALVGYFALPIVAQENVNFDTYNIATQQLIANIEHLKSQLRLANLTIAQYEHNSLANSQKPVEYVLVDSLEEDSKLKLYDGLIQISKTLKIKFFGVEIEFNIPLLIDKFTNNSEDMEDLAVVAERRDEPTTSHEDLLAELKQDGIL
ncbi:hypothetical protein H1P_110016 [Hyella patelloides LEGE 07179]|uniref:Uncharacterized protein n=1 Tax=Hyella patelloides LEGE 07179 TaxID=945734 RepID=A0A563VJD0_9CYAN|nr:hypothetical protein H1P_110016 [Hyella patelloides LEGE 07179]